jgi:hypothetical protein
VRSMDGAGATRRTRPRRTKSCDSGNRRRRFVPLRLVALDCVSVGVAGRVLEIGVAAGLPIPVTSRTTSLPARPPLVQRP